MSTALATRLPTKQWKEERSEYIGGSDVAAILGESSYKTPLMVWKTKKGLLNSQPDPNITRFGHLFEPILAQYFMDHTGLKVQQANLIRVDKEYSFLRANIDRLILSSDKHPAPGILELKTTNSFLVKQWEGEYPKEWKYQIQHYLMITGYDYAYLQVYERDTCRFHNPVFIEKDTNFIKTMREELVEWWGNFGIRKNRPPALTDEDLMILHPEAVNDKVVYGSAFAKAQYLTLIDLRKKLKVMKEAEDSLIHFLKSEMGDAEILKVDQQTLCSWKNSRSKRLDQTRLKEEQPQIFHKYMTESVTRRFNLKS